jgi:hypothetical protein
LASYSAFMRVEDRIYFLLRAEDELDAARGATHEVAARSHYHLAGLYFDRVFGGAGSDGAKAGTPEATGIQASNQ